MKIINNQYYDYDIKSLFINTIIKKKKKIKIM